MENINRLIVYLLAIANFSKDIHYNCKGDSFYSKHLLCDRISDNLYSYIDGIKEVFFLAADKEPLPSGEYLSRATSQIPQISKEDKACFISLATLLVQALQTIEEMQDLTKGEENLIGAIAENLQTSLGLVNRQIKD